MANEAKDRMPEWSIETAAELLPEGSPYSLTYSIARALLSAERRGVKRALPTLERLRHWIEDEVGAELPFTEAEQAEFDAIRSLGDKP